MVASLKRAGDATVSAHELVAVGDGTLEGLVADDVNEAGDIAEAHGRAAVRPGQRQLGGRSRRLYRHLRTPLQCFPDCFRATI
jgi:hypothetical protein